MTELVIGVFIGLIVGTVIGYIHGSRYWKDRLEWFLAERRRFERKQRHPKTSNMRGPIPSWRGRPEFDARLEDIERDLGLRP